MSTNLLKRILTSIFILIILSICLFINKYFWLTLLMMVSIVCFNEFKNLIKKTWKNQKKKTFLIDFFSFLYLILFIYIGYDLYNAPPIELIFIILICIFSDTGGFIVGKLIGGKKLIQISPNKTISGSMGSFVFSLFPIIIFLIIYKFSGNSLFFPNNIIAVFLVSLFLSLVCQLGDLFISYFKRRAKVKDTSSMLPGHGGLLDRVDGLIFVLPAAYATDKIFF